MPSRATAPLYRWYVLALLTLCYTCASIDRNVMLSLVEPIKNDLALSDGQISLITGVGFSICFVIAGIPIGVLIDKVNRRNLLLVQICIWSATTALGGAAAGFASLLLTRMLVGAAEAGSTPNMMSMLSDLFPRRERATAIGIFNLGVPLGLIGGFAGGGWVAAEFGWRSALFIAGSIGVALTLVLLATMREPVRGAAEATADAVHQASFRDTLKFMVAQPPLSWLIAGLLLMGIALQGFLGFLSPFMVRLHGMDIKAAGITIALYLGIAGGIATPIGGFLADRLGRRNIGWLAWFPTLTFGIGTCASLGLLFAPSVPAVLAMLVTMAVFTHLQYGPLFSLGLSLVPVSMRGRAIAIIYVLTNLGVGLGLIIVGTGSDLFTPHYGIEAVRYGMLTVVPLMVVAAFFFFKSSRDLSLFLQRAATYSSASSSPTNAPQTAAPASP